MANLILTWVKNHLGSKFYPYTHTDAVYVDDVEEKNLTTVLSELNKQIELASEEIQADWNETNTENAAYIKNKPLSLPANGGNSDTLGGKHASDFTENRIFNQHLTDNAAHQDLFNSKLNVESASKLIKNISSDPSTGIITITRYNDTIFTINIPKSLIFQSATFNEKSNEIVIVWSDDSESRIPVEGLVDIYTGSEGDTIQIVVDENNVISAILKEGSIETKFLSPAIQSSIQSSYEHSLNTQKHIPSGGSIGQVIGITEEGIGWIEPKGNSDNIPTKVSELENDSRYISAVDGMGLSSNDFTNENKEKLSNIEQNANNYTHPETHPATMIVEDDMHQFVTAEEKSRIGTGSNITDISFNKETSKLIIGGNEIDLSSLKNSEILNGGGEITPGFNNNMIWRNFNTGGVILNRVDYLNEKFIAIGGTYVFHGTEMPLQRINLQDFAKESTFNLVNVHFYFDSYYMIALESNNGIYTSYIFRTEDLINFEVKILEGKKILGLYFNGSTYLVLDETGNYVYLRSAGKWENFNIDTAYIVSGNYITNYIDWVVNPRFISSISVTTGQYFYSDSEWMKGLNVTNCNGSFLINKALYRWILSNNNYSILREEPGVSTTVWTCSKEVGDKMKFRIGTMCNGKLLLIFGGNAVLVNSFDELDNIVDNGYNDIFTITSSNIKFIVHNYQFMLATTESGELIYTKIS